MKKRMLASLLAGLSLLALCACDPLPPEGAEWKPWPQELSVKSDTLCVQKVENLPDDFIFGMDASCVPALEAGGVRYYDHAGTQKDVFEILRENGLNYIRVRVWNDPYDAAGNGYGGGNCDLNNAIEIGKRATKYEMRLLVDFHYSDFWADPGKQMPPKAWQDFDIEQKSEALYNYTKNSLQALKDAGVHVGMVQIGNETNGALCGESASAVGGWKKICQLLSAGSKAVREVMPYALVAVHFANPEKAGAYADYAQKLSVYDVDYDVFASSYYPYWHGTLDNLASVLSGIATTYDKKVMVAETSYAFTAEDTDFNGNTISEGGGIVKNYPFTLQGQANLVRDVVDTMVNKTVNAMGVFYWEGTWISAGGDSWEENSALWEKNGSGWASSYAAQYDPDDAGKYYGGCAVDNQAFFTKDGKATEALKVFALLKNGNHLPLKADAIEDTNLTVDLNGEITLPATVNAIMSDNSKKAIPVIWEAVDTDAIQAAGAAKYTISGTADGMPATLYLSMVEYNFLQNWSFEEGQTGWTATAHKTFDELYVEDKVTDSITGTKHYHFWGAGADSVEFTLEQEVQNLPAGKYNFEISLMGGDGGSTEIYAFVKVNGEITHRAESRMTVYNQWHTAKIENFSYTQGDDISVGIYIKCAGPNAWGKIEDAKLNSVKE